jgi:hypothetical protein
VNGIYIYSRLVQQSSRQTGTSGLQLQMPSPTFVTPILFCHTAKQNIGLLNIRRNRVKCTRSHCIAPSELGYEINWLAEPCSQTRQVLQCQVTNANQFVLSVRQRHWNLLGPDVENAPRILFNACGIIMPSVSCQTHTQCTRNMLGI